MSRGHSIKFWILLCPSPFPMGFGDFCFFGLLLPKFLRVTFWVQAKEKEGRQARFAGISALGPGQRTANSEGSYTFPEIPGGIHRPFWFQFPQMPKPLAWFPGGLFPLTPLVSSGTYIQDLNGHHQAGHPGVALLGCVRLNKKPMPTPCPPRFLIATL